ncbi:MAG: hypothetical protein J7L07_11795 [Candidatus Odinarchaeota archaeon]|nr:hypothetical protein [Candidatus Odinarchaeota archaeon]
MDIPLNELDSWYEEKIRDKTQDYVKEVNKVIDHIEKDIDFLQELLDIMINTDFKAPELATSSARRLGEKMKELIVEFLDAPEDIRYDTIDDYIARIDKFSEQVFKYGKIWVPQLTKHYKSHLKKIDFFLKDIEKKKNELREIQREYKWVKELQIIFTKVNELRKDLSKLSEYNERLKEYEQQLAKVETELNDVNEKIDVLKSRLKLDELKQINDEIEKMRQEVISILNTFQKPFKKILSAPPSITTRIPGELQQVLMEYSEDPFNALIEEDIGHPKLNKLLRKMKDILNNVDIGLKSSDVRRTLKKIDKILKSNELKRLQEDCKRLFERKKEIEGISGISELEKLREEKEKLERIRSSIKFKIDNLRVQINERENKIKNSKENLETLIKEKIGEEINIVL